jgi:hypothetical protein
MADYLDDYADVSFYTGPVCNGKRILHETIRRIVSQSETAVILTQATNPKRSSISRACLSRF